MKYVLYDLASGEVLQWQDHAQFGFPPPSIGQALKALDDGFGFPSAGSGWWVRNDALTNVPPVAAPLPLGELAEILTTAATAHRWQVETDGIDLPGGVRVKTGKDDQDRITSTIAGMEAVNGITTVDFKADSGWVSLTLADLQAIRAAIALHVQACFSAERAHHDAIAALLAAADRDGLESYDVSAHWPA